ncbi:hypothetical protein GIB67_031251 [Kingdonia uniflora]|uniref:Pentatricopeptide repeat-containing protein n=1 Tax=Kingdonia uniflora TaxID=39325 RepID=A0A7J7NL59_9MAGN|nr:hypothetical protein GIB67_031251 [Kingdonia uniflora]
MLCGSSLGHENFQNPIIISSSSHQCKLQSHFISRVSLGFPIHKTNKLFILFNFPNYQTLTNTPHVNPITRVSLGFKLHCYRKIVVYETTSCKNGGKRSKKGYGGSLPSILQGLEFDENVDKTLSLYVGKLNPKEQTVILKEQRDWRRVVGVFRWLKSQKDYLPNVIHYNVVLRALGRAQKLDELRLCWIEMARDGVFPTNHTYGMLVDVYAKAGLAKEALLWVRHMKQRNLFPDEVTMATVVRVLKNAGEFDKADRFYKDWCIGRVELDGLDLDSADDNWSGIGSHFLSTELFKSGGRMPPAAPVETVSTVRKPRLAATYNALIDLYAKAGRLKDASFTFGEMLKSSVAPDTVTFNTMIFICGTHGDLSEAEALLIKMEERGISPDTKTYNIFLSLHARAGNIDAALMWYRKIREVGLFPDDVTYRVVIRILCERNMFCEVEDVIKEMEKLGVYLDEHSLPVVIRMYAGEGLIDRAKVIFQNFQLRGGMSPKTYAAIIDAYADKGIWTEAEAIFFGKKEKKDVVEYNVMIKAYGKSKLYDRALSLFKSMRSNGTWPDECTYNSLIQMLSGGDLVDLATDFLFEMQEAGFKPLCATFSAIIASNIRLGKISDAVDVYEEMLRAGVKPSEHAYGSLINGYAEAGNVEEALRYFHEMEEFGISTNQIVLTSLIKAYSKVGCLEGTQKMYEKMRDLEGGPDVVASNCMISLYADLGLVSEAKLIFDTLRENGQADVVSFATMMYLYRSMGMLDKAIDVAQEMQESTMLRDCASFNALLESHATNGQLRECGELLHQMITRNITPDDGTVRVMITLMKKCGAPIEAVTQLESSYQGENRHAKQAIITFVFSILGMHDFALDSCGKFTKADMDLESFVYNVAIYAYGSSGNVDKALRIFMKMKDEGLGPDLITYIHLVVCYGKAGMVEGLKRIYSQMKYGEIEPNESLFRAIIDAYKHANRNDLAELASQEMRFIVDKEEQPDLESEDPERFSDHLQEMDAMIG